MPAGNMHWKWPAWNAFGSINMLPGWSLQCRQSSTGCLSQPALKISSTWHDFPDGLPARHINKLAPPNVLQNKSTNLFSHFAIALNLVLLFLALHNICKWMKCLWFFKILSYLWYLKTLCFGCNGNKLGKATKVAENLIATLAGNPMVHLSIQKQKGMSAVIMTKYFD